MSSGENQNRGSCAAMNVSEKNPERLFQCPVCLDLAYKPVVHSCGHVFCFWCTFHSMNGFVPSQCPICRRPCPNFPRICGMLHFLLMKLMPEEYRRRAQETHEYEIREQMLSPRILPSLRTHYKEDYPLPTKPSRLPDKCATEMSSSTSGGPKGLQSPPSTSSKRGGEVFNLQQHSLCEDQICNNFSAIEKSWLPDKCATQASSSASQGPKCPQSPLALSEKGQEECGDHMCNNLSVLDFSCTACKQFLYEPVVLHCGEVFCQGCVAKLDSSISCPSCCGAHPGGSVDVCLDLKHYLECAFPEYVLERKADASQKGAQRIECALERNIDASQKGAQRTVNETCNYEAAEETQAVHVGAGCDGCGMHPIIGERYTCADCPEKIGYDLCGDCYKKGTNWDGRFNQQHTANHCMHKISIDPVFLSVLSSSYYEVFLASQDSSEHSTSEDDDAHDVQSDI